MKKNAIVPFDYSVLSKDTKGKLVWFAGEIRKQCESHAKAGLEMGRLLLAARAMLDSRKPGSCGPATALLILDQLTNNRDAFNNIRGLYKEHGENVGFTHYDTGAELHWGHVFASEAKLLWMRREAHNENCVLNWLKEAA